MSLFTDDIILYTENLKNSPNKLQELINEFSKVEGCKISMQKFVAFLYNNNNQKVKLRKLCHLQLYQK